MARKVLSFSLCVVASYGAPASPMIRALCTDAAQKDVEAAGLIHEHLMETEAKCKKSDDVAACEGGMVARIGAAKANVTSFYIEHCVWHMMDAKAASKLKTLHPLVDKFESEHMKEIKEELHKQIHAAMANDVKFTLRVLCEDEVLKKIQDKKGDELVHEHLGEIEDGCKGKADCESKATAAIIAAKQNVSAFYTLHCFDHVPPTAGQTLKDLHPKVDDFAEEHAAEIKSEFHNGIHAAMSAAGLEAKFSLLRAPIRAGGVSSAFGGFAVAFMMLAVLGAVVTGGRACLRVGKATEATAKLVTVEEGSMRELSESD